MAAGVPDRRTESLCSIGWPIIVVRPGMSLIILSISRLTTFFLYPGLMAISISELQTGAACSSPSARPVLRTTARTPSMWRNLSSSPRARRSLSIREVPGGELTKTVKVPSLNSGRKLVPKVPANSRLASVKTNAVVITVLRRLMEKERAWR